MLRVTSPGDWGSADAFADATRRKYLLPGDVTVCSEPTVISTVLGSCVSVCLFDSQRRNGGMNHFVLPRAGTDRSPSPRFGPFAMQVLLDRMTSFGSRRQDIVAFLYGGACVLRSANAGPNHLGMQNVRAAQAFLEENRILVLRQDAGGDRGRQVRFHTDTGDTFVRRF